MCLVKEEEERKKSVAESLMVMRRMCVCVYVYGCQVVKEEGHRKGQAEDKPKILFSGESLERGETHKQGEMGSGEKPTNNRCRWARRKSLVGHQIRNIKIDLCACPTALDTSTCPSTHRDIVC